MNCSGYVFVACMSLALAACGDDHAHESGAGHAHAPSDGESETHDDDAGHGHGGGIAVTDFTDATELFVEYAPLVKGELSAFAAHLTRLSDYAPVDRGSLVVRLSGGGHPDERARSGPAATAGIFRPAIRPAHAGQRRLTLELATPGLTVVHDLGTVTVYPSRRAADAAQTADEPPAGAIVFLKEQQWTYDFALARVAHRTLRASVPATGMLRGTADGEAYLSALADGRIMATGNDFPRIGQQVEAGEPIARLVPRLGADQDYAKLRADLAQARSRHELALSEHRRLKGLHADGAVPQRRVDEAVAARDQAKAGLEAARARLGAAAERTEPEAGLVLRSPVAGRLVAVEAHPGQFVEAGAMLFHIVNGDRLWLEAAVSAAHSSAIDSPEGAWFLVEDRREPIRITPDTGRLVGAGDALDPVRRTLPVVFEFDNPDPPLRVGTAVSARLYTGEKTESLAIPAGAVVDEAGQSIVYVMNGGESFMRRSVRIGLRDGAYVAVESGLAEGERVVSEGAYLVRLAAGSAEVGHGHAH